MNQCPEPGEPVSVRPPLGVIPHALWIDKRKQELARAISEYVQAGMYGPVDEWWNELRNL